MKKIIKWIGLFLIFACITKVQASNYKVKELIPKEIETTIETENFRYKQIYYNGAGEITFKGIKNISEKELPISISIGLFDSKKKNIGMVNNCSADRILLPEEEQEYTIDVEEYLTKDKTISDIHYIAVIADNTSCRTDGKDEFVGKKVEDVGKIDYVPITTDLGIFIKVMAGVGIGLLVIFLYKYMFTNSYVNMDGEEVREDYKAWNREQAKKRKNAPAPVQIEKPKPNAKSERILAEEERAKAEQKETTDLHNLYK